MFDQSRWLGREGVNDPMGIPHNCQVTTQGYNFQLVYGQEDVVLDEFVIPSLFISQVTQMAEEESLQKLLDELSELDEARFMEDFY